MATVPKIVLQINCRINVKNIKHLLYKIPLTVQIAKIKNRLLIFDVLIFEKSLYEA